MTTKLNKVILRVAKSNPEFRRALAAELAQDKTAMRFKSQKAIQEWQAKTALDNEWDNAAFHLSDGLRGAWGRLEMLNKIVGGSSWQWGGSELFSRMDGWPKDWAKFKETVEKAKENFDRGYQGVQKADAILAERRRLRAERQKYLFDVLKEMTRNMPPGVSGAQPFKADVWNPKFKWKGPKGQKELWLDFDHSMSPASKNLDTRFIEVEANGLKSFEVKNTNPKDAAARIWEQLAAQGVA
jgi:hypothetical protein